MRDIQDIHHDMVLLKSSFTLFRTSDLDANLEGVVCIVNLLGEKIASLSDELEIWIRDNEK